MEIKFRGFSIENNCWIYGFYHEVEVEGIKHAYIFWQGDSFPVDILSVGLFSGAYDKNGVEIYSGDIYKHGNDKFYDNINNIILYRNGTFLISSVEDYNNIGKKDEDGNDYSNDNSPLFWYFINGIEEEDIDCSWLEVIGNTYETHPDLIK